MRRLHARAHVRCSFSFAACMRRLHARAHVRCSFFLVEVARNPCVGFSRDAWPPQGGPVQQPHNPMLARSQALPGTHTP
jgi:hypothetical protein